MLYKPTKQRTFFVAAKEKAPIGIYVLVAVIVMAGWIYLLGSMAEKAVLWLFS